MVLLPSGGQVHPTMHSDDDGAAVPGQGRES